MNIGVVEDRDQCRKDLAVRSARFRQSLRENHRHRDHHEMEREIQPPPSLVGILSDAMLAEYMMGDA